VRTLLACPFCRELYATDEGIERCPACGLVLQSVEQLPANPLLEPELDEDDVRLSPWDPSKNRGALLLGILLGLGVFFAPWVHLTAPEDRSFAAFDLARAGAPWLWSVATAWFVLGPLVFTRRTRRAQRGARLIVGLLAAVPAVDVAMIAALPAASHSRIPVHFEWSWGPWITGFLSLVCVVLALGFGGASPKPTAALDAAAPSTERRPRRETLH